MDWQERAACSAPGVDPDLFFPHGGGGRGRSNTDVEREEEAVRICQEACPVMEQCRAYAIRTGEYNGVWGGLTENGLRYRVKLARAQAKVAA